MKKLVLMFILGIFLISFMNTIEGAWTEDLNSDLLFYYKLDASSGDVVDSLGNYSGTNNGATRGVTGKIENAFNFDGIDDYVSSSLVRKYLDFTFSGWVKWDHVPADGYEAIYSVAQDGNSQFPLILYYRTGFTTLKFDIQNTENHLFSAEDTSWTPVADKWYHIVATANTTGAYLYVNGTLIASDTTSSAATPPNPDYAILGISANDRSSSPLNGTIDEVGVWDRSLTPDEVTQLYNSGVGITYPLATPSNVTLNSPIDYYNTTINNINFNCTASDSVGITNVSFYLNGALNQTNSSGLNNTDYIFSKTLTNGFYNWSCSLTNSNNQTTTATYRYLNISNFFVNSQTYSATTSEGATEQFSINVTFDSSFTNYLAYLVYNNTNYVSTYTTEGNNYIFMRNLTVPSITSQTNYTFYWNFILNNGTDNYFNSSSNTQTINQFLIDNCSAYTTVLYNFTLVDEISQTELNETGVNTSAKLNLQLYTSDGKTLIQSMSTNYTKINPFAICINSNLTGNEEYKLNLQLEYDATGYAHEFYHIQEETITSDDLNTNITLYDLDDTNSQEFKISYKDENFIAVDGALIQIQRKYLEEGLSKTIEIPKTDSNGETIAHLQLSDVIYSFIITKNGEILSTFNDVIAYCDNAATGDCKIDFNSFSSHAQPEDFTELDDFSFSPSWNSTTRVITIVFSIPSGSVSTIKLNATLFDMLQTTEVCSDTLSTASGTLSCTVPASYQNSTIIWRLYKNNNFVGQGTINMWDSPSTIYNTNITTLGLLLALTIIGMGFSSEIVVTIFMFLLGVILNTVFHLISDTGFIGNTATILWFIAALVIILIKVVKRN